MKNIKPISVTLGILVALEFASLPAKAEQIIHNYQNYSQWTRIVNPDVNVPFKEYPDITFQNGDTVFIKAGGCVQTGGSGKTWKRYVQPSSDNAGLYYGEIEIPGAINNLTKLSEIVASEGAWSRRFDINDPINTFPVKTLELGYIDDGYSDNGYWGHDDGTGNQCLNVYGAYVDIWIQRQ
ncbi:MAG: hypothetical protein V7K14_26520 [Nostoc sp.]|uniref:hypothetical protein n=1 Tax=Nostoc sp. TaxID=1180 RepID=UPI002FF52073